ncbi:MAG: LCP family protein [Oscillospiraceae bacterium]|nr:LCP family protein [Oscillospiraceae bacterium]
MSYHGHFEKAKPPKKKKKGWKVLLIVLCVILLLGCAAAVAGVAYYKSMIGKVNYIEMPTDPTLATEEVMQLSTEAAGSMLANGEVAVEETETEETTVETTVPAMKPEDIINILLVGQSARGGEEGRLADTMILASINKYTKTLTLTSFLRDTYVDLPDYRQSNGRLRTCGWNKLTTCYALGYSFEGTAGAMKMTNDCLYNNFGVEVDYNVEVDFDCFIDIVNLLDGVGIEITQAEADYLNADDRFVDGHFEAGWVSLTGSEALSYARMRKAEGDNDSDIVRTERQRKLINALLNNVRNAKLSQLQKIVNEVLPMIATNMSGDEITKFLVEIVPMLPDLKIASGTCPIQGLYWSEYKDTPDGYMPVLMFNSGEHKALMRQITEGEGLE